MYVRHEYCKYFCIAFLGRLSRAQGIADDGSANVAHTFSKGEARDASVHSLLRALLDLQMRARFKMTSRGIISEADYEGESMTRSRRDELVRLRTHVFAEVWVFVWIARYRYNGFASAGAEQ